MMEKQVKVETKKPLLSIVIANYNFGRFLGEAIESVVAQINDAGEGMVELIICDAASTDNSVEVIKKYERYITWWCSEKDGGQSAAFNKGFSHASGKFLTWLNADDVMFPNVVRKLKEASDKHPTCEWFVGGTMFMDPDMKILNCRRARPFSRMRAKSGRISACGPSSFFTKQLLQSVGGVDERLNFSMDGDLWRKFYFLKHVVYRPFCCYAWGMRLHDHSKTSAHRFATCPEELKLSTLDARPKKDEDLMQHVADMRKLTFLELFFSVHWWSALMGRLDSLRYRTRHYKQVSV